MKNFRMNNPVEVRRTLQRVSNMVLNDEIDTKKANTIIFACNSILNSIRLDEQEKRLNELETILLLKK